MHHQYVATPTIGHPHLFFSDLSYYRLNQVSGVNYDIKCVNESKKHFFDRLNINDEGENLTYWFNYLEDLTSDELIIACYLVEKHDYELKDFANCDFESYAVVDPAGLDLHLDHLNHNCRPDDRVHNNNFDLEQAGIYYYNCGFAEDYWVIER